MRTVFLVLLVLSLFLYYEKPCKNRISEYSKIKVRHFHITYLLYSILQRLQRLQLITDCLFSYKALCDVNFAQTLHQMVCYKLIFLRNCSMKLSGLLTTKHVLWLQDYFMDQFLKKIHNTPSTFNTCFSQNDKFTFYHIGMTWSMSVNRSV